ncbi:toll/interleukin-1 receptor domain-containing protein [Variovorax sp. J22R115]|uniref:toll/interleukin-1 receptor domain-containing protein n=1 Tax=Variovorax sp. J22R115 TaxID=3053509 RepID=UPI0025761C0B|nr:toll/interleukin-1 receptor domain-containing protein [Variovorax sp. J22R115]MDM0048617.1 toll/interleukin-1 receptor domain-containing protein [Variovorax sp. J22R115]
MQFEYDVFISYAHIDNQPFTREQEGWVTVFDNVLQIMLDQQLGKKTKVWFDKSLQGNDDYSAEIACKLPNAATLVSVLTPRYLASGWCTKEIRLFCQLAKATGGLFVKNKGRVFKVMKSPIARVESDRVLPPEVGCATGYEFFLRSDGEAAIELDLAYGKTYEQVFLLRVRRLAGDIADLLRQFGDVVALCNAPVAAIGRPIYLAQCCASRKADRESVLSDLRSHGLTVLPDDDMPDDETGFIAEADCLLAECRLSIHLIGSSYGPVPDGDGQKSTIVLQNEIASRHSRSRGLPRIISLPENTASSNAAQQAFIESLLTQSDMQFGADLLTGDVQSLIEAIHARLSALPTPTPNPPAQTAGLPKPERRRVHILHDQKDTQDVLPLMKFIKSNGMDVTWPIFEGQDSGRLRELNESLCLRADAVILFYGAGDPTWMYYRRTELMKLRGLGDQQAGRPSIAEVTLVSGPNSTDKDMVVEMAGSDVVDVRSGLSDVAFAQLLPLIQYGGEPR